MRRKNSSFVYMYAAVCSDQSIYRHVRTSFSQYKKTIQASKCILNFKPFASCSSTCILALFGLHVKISTTSVTLTIQGIQNHLFRIQVLTCWLGVTTHYYRNLLGGCIFSSLVLVEFLYHTIADAHDHWTFRFGNFFHRFQKAGQKKWIDWIDKSVLWKGSKPPGN